MFAENYTSVTEKATGWKGQFKTKNPFNLRLDKKKQRKKTGISIKDEILKRLRKNNC